MSKDPVADAVKDFFDRDKHTGKDPVRDVIDGLFGGNKHKKDQTAEEAEAAAPVQETPSAGPVQESQVAPEPSYTQPTPTEPSYAQPAPATRQPASNDYNQPAPGFARPVPAEQPAPFYAAPTPVEPTQPAPSKPVMPEPFYSPPIQSQPVQAQPEPVMAAPAPVSGGDVEQINGYVVGFAFLRYYREHSEIGLPVDEQHGNVGGYQMFEKAILHWDGENVRAEWREGQGPQPEAAASRTYRVNEGDNLSNIAQQVYGDAAQWQRIYEANRDKISDPNLIYAGQELQIP